jgi:hypothetical protein
MYIFRSSLRLIFNLHNGGGEKEPFCCCATFFIHLQREACLAAKKSTVGLALGMINPES